MLYCWSGLGLSYEALGKHQEALTYHKKALQMREEMQSKAGIAREYYYISFVFANTQQKKKALSSLRDAKLILEEFERHTGYRHPMLGQVQERISSLQRVKQQKSNFAAVSCSV